MTKEDFKGLDTCDRCDEKTEIALHKCLDRKEKVEDSLTIALAALDDIDELVKYNNLNKITVQRVLDQVFADLTTSVPETEEKKDG